MAEIVGQSGLELSSRYAAALYALAFEQGVLDAAVAQMAALGAMLAEDKPLARLIANPLTDARKAAAALTEAMAQAGFLPLLGNFVRVVAANRRLSALPALVTGFARYVADKRGEHVAEVSTAHALNEVQRHQLRARLAEAGWPKVRLVEHVDASLLGGLVLKIGSKMIDTTLKSRLSRLTYSLKGAA